MIQGRRVTVPLFELADQPKINLSAVKSRRFFEAFECPVCGERIEDLLGHCREARDGPHMVAEVMLS